MTTMTKAPVRVWFTKHGVERMVERRIRKAEVLEAVEKGQRGPVEYNEVGAKRKVTYGRLVVVLGLRNEVITAWRK